MIIYLIYGVVIFIATFLGAIAGLGGGVIIKPILDLIAFHDVSTISFYSTVAVFIMSLYSLIKNQKSNNSTNYTIITLIAIGSIIGGNLGNKVFTMIVVSLAANIVKVVQSLLLAFILVIVLILTNKNSENYNIKNKSIIVFVGFLLGMISSFLGIGGGPLNVAVFVLFFSVDIKVATIYSLATILFSQTSKLVTIATNTGFGSFDLSYLIVIVPMALLGGIIGSYFYKKVSKQTVLKIFNYAVVFVLLINLYNAITALV